MARVGVADAAGGSMETPVCRVLQRPGIPVYVARTLRKDWMAMCVAAVLLFVVLWETVRPKIYSRSVLSVSDATEIHAVLEGCDAMVVERGFLSAGTGAYSFRESTTIRLGFWSFMGKGSVLEKNGTVNIKAEMWGKTVFKCYLVVEVPRGSSRPHMKVLNLTVLPSTQQLTARLPSTAAEMILITLRHFRAAEGVYVQSRCQSRALLEGVDAPFASVAIHGGSLEISDHGGAAPRDLRVTALSAGVDLRLHNNDAHVVVDPETMAWTSLAGANITQEGGSGSWERYRLVRGSNVAGPVINVNITSKESALYLLAADEQHMGYASTSSCPELQVKVGSVVAEGPTLTPSVKQILSKELGAWLVRHTSSGNEYVVYIKIAMPDQREPGILKLLSSEVYTALPPWAFALISGGSMEPDVVRITAPFAGGKGIFPARPCDVGKGKDVSDRQVELGKQIVEAADASVGLIKLGLNGSKWVWDADPGEGVSLIYDWIAAKNGHQGGWRARDASAISKFKAFASIALGITAVVGLYLSANLMHTMYEIVRPFVLDAIRKVDLFSTASYRLQNTIEQSTWVLTSTCVQFPAHGLLLRWKTRPMASKFATFTFEAQAWPAVEGAEPVKITGIDPLVLPMFKYIKDQRVFLLLADPQASVRDLSSLADPFDVELNEVARRQVGTARPTLQFGVAYRVRCTAYDAQGKQVERSSWGRPTLMQPPRATTTFPLLLCRNIVNLPPSDPLAYFLEQTCEDMEAIPNVVLVFKQVKLAVDSDCTLFMGEYNVIGKEKEADYFQQHVRVQISTNDLECPVYETTRGVPLPTIQERREKKLVKPSFAEAMPAVAKSGMVSQPPKAKFVILDFGHDGIRVKVPFDLTQTVSIEAVLVTPNGDSDSTAKVVMTWANFLSQATEHLVEPVTTGLNRSPSTFSSAKAREFGAPMAVLLRDGLTRVAVLSMECFFESVTFGSPRLEEWSAQTEGFPRVFGKVVPAQTIVYGESLVLSWTPVTTVNLDFDIILVSESCAASDPTPIVPGPVRTTVEGYFRLEDVVAAGVSVSAGRVSVVIGPNHPPANQRLWCHLEARVKGGSRMLARSSQFCVGRQVTLQQLELVYAAFCVRNRIPMAPMNEAMLFDHYGIQMAQRKVRVARGYRLPLPMAAEAAAATFKVGEQPTVIENSFSHLILGSSKLLVEDTSTDAGGAVDAGGASAAGGASTTAGAPAASPGSSNAASASTPLLEAAAEPEPKIKVKEVKSATVTAQVTTNVFWKWKSGRQAKPQILLMYFCLPKCLTLRWFQEKLGIKRRKMLKLEDFLFWITMVLKITVGILIYVFQLVLLTLPCYLLLFMWIWHDVVIVRVASGMEPDPDVVHMRLHDYLGDPTFQRWSQLSVGAQVFLSCVCAYLVLFVVSVFFFNFFAEHILSMRFGRLLARVLNDATALLIKLSLFVLITVAVVVLVWIALGAIINPGSFLPKTIALGAIIGIAMAFKGKMQAMKDHVDQTIGNVVDHIINAIFSVAFGAPGVAEGDALRVQSLNTFTEQMCTYMEGNEKIVREALFEKSKVKDSVLEALMESMRLLRASPEFQILDAKALEKNEVLITDFTPGSQSEREECTSFARLAANEEFRINNPGALLKEQIAQAAAMAVATGGDASAFADCPILTKHLLRAISRLDPSGIEAGAIRTPEKTALLDRIAKTHGLRSETVSSMYEGYVRTVHDQRLQFGQSEPKLNDPCAMAAMFSHIRRTLLLDHFDSKGTVASPTAGPSPDANVKKMMRDIQSKEMENISVLTAQALATRLDWDQISREAADYVNTTLSEEVLSKVIYEQLNCNSDQSAAFKLRMNAFDLAFERFESVYQVATAHSLVRKEVQFFVDCGVCSELQTRNPDLVARFKKAVDDNLAFDGSCCPDTLMAALQALLLPEFKQKDQEGNVAFSYLWYDALESILKKSGWNTNDRDIQEWLPRRWDEITNGLGLFPYQALSEVADMIVTTLCGSGLWPAAVKALMLRVKVCGYIGCNVAKVGVKKAAAAAHTLQFVDIEDLSAVESKAGEWPEEVVNIWKKHAQWVGGGGPLLLPGVKVVDFLQDVVYDLEQDKKPDKDVHPLSPYAASWKDLLWMVGMDGRVWHTLPSGSRCLRGLFLEVALDLFTLMSSVPTDLDVFIESLHWQLSVQSGGEQLISSKVTKIGSLGLGHFAKWLHTTYFKHINWCSFPQFKAIMVEMLSVDLPDTTLRLIFDPCPKNRDDDQGELRRLDDLGAALVTHLGYGLWSNAVKVVIMDFIPTGPRQNKALENAKVEFQKMDKKGRGFLQPGEVVLLVQKLAVLGLTCEDVEKLLQKRLNLQIPHAELHKYFAMMDLHVDGMVQAEEFIPMMAFLVMEFFPAQVLENMRLSTGSIVYYVTSAIMVMGLLFGLMELVVNAFEPGSAAAAVHASANTLTAYAAKQSSDKIVGFEDTMVNLKREIERQMIHALCLVIGLSKDVIDRLFHLLEGSLGLVK